MNRSKRAANAPSGSAHDGAEGDPYRATRWLDRPPTGHEWVATLRALSRADVRVQPGRPGLRPAHDSPWVAVTPHLVTREAAEAITKASFFGSGSGGGGGAHSAHLGSQAQQQAMAEAAKG